jgi:hypothetical protein
LGKNEVCKKEGTVFAATGFVGREPFFFALAGSGKADLDFF